ncbi:pectinesterase inhibitor [Phtheirospermum japonicum]|uniref:Pectinesterase inhibitor n=1 Tax=Phtheirospermum japonicum TaxID=374723 RepID=A0A830CZF2_9LAMI|nr:pectinesterase inhibitor [Phtheirospermum japonicum]
MAYSSKTMIVIALIIMIAISPSLGRREKSDREKELRDLVSQTDESKESWKIIKPQLSRFTDTDPKIVADVILDLAITRGDEIHEQLNRLHEDSRNDELKSKYLSCSKNYNDAIRNLKLAKRNLGSDDFHKIPIEIDDTIEELNSCVLEFEGDSFDPAHIRNRQKEFGNYVNIVKVATDRLQDQN